MAARTAVPCHIANASNSVGRARGCCAVADNLALSTVSLGPAVARTLVSSHLESIATQSERMMCLLAALGRRVMHRDRRRRVDDYVRVQVFDRPDCPVSGLMRHLCDIASIEIALLS